MAGAKTAVFYLASLSGTLIQRIQMQRVSANGDLSEYIGTVQLPDSPFRVAVTGLDSNGVRYQRFFASLFHSESVEVSWNHAFDELPAGSTKQVEFTIRNGAFARTLQLTVTDAHHFMTRAEPRELTLGIGQSATIVVDLTIPAETPLGAGDDLIVVATSTDSPATSNSSVAHFSVVK
jgi:hypothetical protein